MGLDMYLNRMPRYKGISAKKISVMENWFDYQEKRAEGNIYANCTFKEWCGCDEKMLPSKETLEYFKQFYTIKYSYWDTKRKYGHSSIMEQVGYWRKSNQIHNWFVENVQNGIDDCNYHNEVTEETLIDLRDTCIAVLNASQLENGKVYCGSSYVDGEMTENYEDGLVVEDSTVAEELLPTTGGFFFGGTGYDEYYIDDLKQTVAIIDKVLEETDFETQMIYYVSSW